MATGRQTQNTGRQTKLAETIMMHADVLANTADYRPSSFFIDAANNLPVRKIVDMKVMEANVENTVLAATQI